MGSEAREGADVMSRLDLLGLRAIERGRALVLLRGGGGPRVLWCGRGDTFWWSALLVRDHRLDGARR